MTISAKAFRHAVLSIFTLFLASCQPEPENEADLTQLQVEAHLDVAELYRQQGQYRAAEIEALNALRIKPNGNDVRSFMARLYHEIGDINNAKNFISTVYAADPQNPEIALVLAELEYRSGATFRAQSILDRLENLSNEAEKEKRVLLGSIHAMREDFDQARDEFETVLQIDPAYVDALIAYSRLETALGNRIQAQQLIDSATTADPRNLDVVIWQGQFAMLTGDYAEAEESLYQAIDAMSEYDTMTSRRFMAMQNIQAVLQAQQKNQEALRYAELIAASPQGQYLAGFEQALELYQQGDLEEAEAAILGLLAINPNDTDSQTLMGMTRYAQQDYEAAREVLNSLVENDSATPRAIKQLAAVYMRQNQSTTAIQTLTSALENYPRDASLLGMLGMTYQSIGDLETSLDYLEQSLEIAPNDIRNLYALAQTFYLQEEYDSAKETLRGLLEINPRFTGGKSSLIGIYLLEEDFSGARNQVQEWLDQQPGSIVNSVLAGWVAFSEGNYPEAQQLFETTLGADPDNIQSHLFLSRIHLISESYGAAADMYESLLEIDPENIEGISGLLSARNLEGSLEEAISTISRIAESEPNNFVAPLILSQFQLRADNLEESMRWAEVAWSRERNDATRGNLANNYAAAVAANTDTGILEAASQLLEDATTDDSEVISSLANLVRQAIEERNPDEALRIARLMQTNFPDSISGHFAEGDVHSEFNDYSSALTAFMRAWDIDHSSILGARIHYTLTTLNRQGDARQFLDEWIAEFPDDGPPNILIGIDFLNANNEARALEHFEIAYQQQPTNPLLLNNLAWVLRESDIERGIELARQATEYQTNYADALDTLGWLMHLNGDSELAVQYLQQAADIQPDSVAISDHLAAASAAI